MIGSKPDVAIRHGEHRPGRIPNGHRRSWRPETWREIDWRPL